MLLVLIKRMMVDVTPWCTELGARNRLAMVSRTRTLVPDYWGLISAY